ncbi:MAG TPA: methyltransferase domain-containing protein [Gemmatimonadales bacterium]|nr:methyltransferase domain-containing protein [Gemmatimonadales bacterium]
MSKRTAARELAFLMPHLRPGMTILDCGCGPGSITIGLAEAVAPGDVVGVDVEPRQLDSARQLAAERGVPNLRFESASIYELPFADASFDVAVAHFVIEHVSDPLRALREMRRVLKPGGIAAVKDPYYPAFTLRPRIPTIVRFEELTAKVRARIGASVAYAADLRAYLLEAGFERTVAEAGTETPAGSEAGSQLLPFVMQNQLRERVFRETILEQGWATPSELDALHREAGALAERNDLFAFVVYVQALGWAAG